MSTHTVVVALHLQNSIIHPDGAVGRRGNAAQVAARGVIENVQRLFQSARSCGAPVIHIGGGTLRNHPGVISSAPLFQSVIAAGIFVRGTWGAAFHSDIAPAPGEATLYHTGVLSFPTTNLQNLLNDYNVQRVLLCGTATRLVIEAAVFECTDRGYEVCVVEDCCASADEEQHEDSIAMMSLFADVVTSHDAEELFKQPQLAGRERSTT